MVAIGTRIASAGADQTVQIWRTLHIRKYFLDYSSRPYRKSKHSSMVTR